MIVASASNSGSKLLKQSMYRKNDYTIDIIDCGTVARLPATSSSPSPTFRPPTMPNTRKREGETDNSLNVKLAVRAVLKDIITSFKTTN